MTKRLLALGLVALLSVGCFSQLQRIQGDLEKIYGKTFGVVNAGQQAILASIPNDVASGRITAAQGEQLKLCPTAILAFGQMLEKQIGTTIPPGADLGWLLYEIRISSSADVDLITTQAKVVVGTCQSMVKIPGLPF